MKRIVIFSLTVLLFFSVGSLAYAQQIQQYEDLFLDKVFDNDLLEQLPEHTQRDLAQLGFDQSDPQSILEFDFTKLANQAVGLIETQIKQPLRSLFQIVGVVVLMAVLDAVRTTSEKNKNLAQVFEITSAMAICTVMARPLIQCITDTSAVIVDCSEFILSFLPVYTGLITACGQAGTASTTHLFLFWACQVASRFASEFLVGLVGLYVAVCIAGVVSPSLNIEGISNGAKSVLTWSLGLLMTLFVGMLTLSSVVAAGGDNIGTRTARFFLGSFVPVVGGALSEAFTTAQSCLLLIKSSVGVYGIVVVAVLFLPVIIRLLCWYVTAGISAVISNLLGLAKISGLLKSMGTALGILMALLLCFLLILLVTFTLVLILGQGVV